MMFLLFLFLLLALMYGYVALRMANALPVPDGLKRSLKIWLVLCWLLSPLPIWLRTHAYEGAWVDVLSWFVYLNMGFFSLLFVAGLLLELLQLTHHFWRKGKPEAQGHAGRDRRAFMRSSMHAGVFAATGSMTGLGVGNVIAGPVVKEVQVPVRGLPDALQSLRIVQITDMHVGPTVKRAYVQDVVDQVNTLDADLVVVTGDMVDGTVHHLQHDVAPLADIQARYGKFFITGNHEYYSGVLDWLAEMQRLGFTTLLNEHAVITHEGHSLLLAGVTDYRAHQYLPEHASDPHKAIEGAPDVAAKLLLAHQPKSVFEAARAGYDLQISGHTHGGQYYPWTFVARLANPYVQGLHLHEGMWIYVSPGTGYWGPPVRLGTRAEISLIRLRTAQA